MIRQYPALFYNIWHFLAIFDIFENSIIFIAIRHYSSISDAILIFRRTMSKNVTFHNFHCRIVSRTLEKVRVYSGGWPFLLTPFYNLRRSILFWGVTWPHFYVPISCPASPLKIVVFCPPTEFQNIQKGKSCKW